VSVQIKKGNGPKNAMNPYLGFLGENFFFKNFRNGLNLTFLFTKLFLYVNFLMKILENKGNNIFFLK
jgi:hypothetical protein